MPIPIEKLETAAIPLRDRVLELLRGNPEQAFTLWEILAGVEGYAEASVAWLILADAYGAAKRSEPVRAVLEALVEDGTLRTADYQGTTYYAVAGSGRR